MAVSDRPAPVGALSFGNVMIAIGGIYVTQTLVSALTFQALPAVLRSSGVGLDSIALLSAAMLPWALKFIWAPAVERYRLPAGAARRSRQIIVAGQLGIGVVFAAMSLADPANVPVILLMLGLSATISATVDIACDGFAIEQLRAHERGWGNVAQVGGSYLGALFGGGLFLVLVARMGWSAAAAGMAGFIVLMTLPFALTREPRRSVSADFVHRPSLAYALARPEIRLGLVLTVMFDAGARLAFSVVSPFMVDAGVDLATLGWAFGVGGAIAGMLGTLAGGVGVRMAGTRVAVIATIGLQISSLLVLVAFASAGSRQHEWLIAALLWHSAVMAIGYVSLYSHLMGLASLRQAGVDFTLFQCANAAASMVVGFLGTIVAQRLGYAGSFALALAMAIATMFIMPIILRRLPSAANEAVTT
ncbi:MFS transporter [Bradyrhizobium sp.]|uniref:MFS transporter n=1 Tax=Bradyrhizobium sp. TaxID=376 RepID=UPI0039E4311C